MKCKEINELIHHYLDGEVEREQEERVAAHLADCPRCAQFLDECRLTRDRLVGHFREELAAAPPPPSLLTADGAAAPPRAGTGRRRSLWVRLVVAAAASLLVGAGVLFNSGTTVEASPAELLRQAAGKALAGRNVEIMVTVRSQALEALFELADNLTRKDARMEPFRILHAAPHRYLYSPAPTPGRWDAVDRMAGFDGTTGWVYDRRAGTVKLSRNKERTFKVTLLASKATRTTYTFKEGEFFNRLSWDYLRQLNRESHTIVETTAPLERRQGYRTFRLTRKSKPDSTTMERLFNEQSTVTIDPEKGTIERYSLNLTWAGLDLARIGVDVVAQDRPYPTDFFKWATHLPRGTRVVTQETPKPKKRKQ